MPFGRNPATPNEDYQNVSGRLRITPQETEYTISVPINTDMLDEPAERFRVHLSNPVNARLDSDKDTITVRIQDQYRGGTTDPYTPKASLHLLQEGPVGEDAETVWIEVRLDGVSGQDITLGLSIDGTKGTATAGADYQDIATLTLGMPFWQTTVLIPIAIMDDEENEEGETFEVALTYFDGAAAGTPSTLTMTIDDDDDVLSTEVH